MLEALLKYPPSLFASGSLELAWHWLAWAALAVAGVLLAGWLNRPAVTPTFGRHERWLAVALRGALLVLLATLLARPLLVVSTDQAERGAVLMLLDESQSMRLQDGSDESRATRAAVRLHPRDGDTAAALAARFELRWHAYGARLRALTPEQWPAFDAARSDLAAALRAVADGPARAPLAGVVLVSDGGEEGGDLDGALLALRARGVPVHVLAAGDPAGAPDVELSALGVPSRVFAGDSVELVLEIAATGFAGQRTQLTVSVGGTRRVQREVELPSDGTATRLPLNLTLATPGLAHVEARLTALPGESVRQNNIASALVQVLAQAPPVLHYEAEPRFEVKFLRRALAEDAALSLVSVVRTADNKFYRLGVDDDDDLLEGFPHSETAMFRFGVVVLGLSQVSTLDDERLELLEAFVARRGGGLVLLGGPRDGQRLPAVIERLSPLAPVSIGRPPPVAVRVIGTDAARSHPLTRFLLGEDAPMPLSRLPPLTVALAAPAAKPGASTLLLGETASGPPLVVLASHRYGRGRVVALPVRDTWRWQMHADVPVDDATHQTFWRQQLRWLARQVPQRIAIRTTPASAVPGSAVDVRVRVLDEEWWPSAGAPPALAVSTPLGERLTPMLRAMEEQPGVYEASFVPAATGAYELRVSDEDAGGATAEAWLQVSDSGREFLSPRQHESVLRRVAAGTGGSYRPLAEANDLLRALEPASTGNRVTRRLPLWDVPLAYLLLVLLVCGEWWLRRRRRLP